MRSTSSLAWLAVTCAWLGVCATAASAAGTEQRRFDAFAADGAPTVRVVKTETASSCSASSVNSQSTALRCFADSVIRDPCFLDPNDGDRAVCVESPSARSGVAMRGVEKADDGRRNTPSSRTPWAIELRGGATCSFVSGASNTRGSRRLNYGCDDNRFLWGRPDRAESFWTILRSRSYSGRGWRRAKIAIAWR